MVADKDILKQIKQQVLLVLPTATIKLFGSRAYGTPTEESDWDLLVLTKQPVEKGLKNKVHDSIFPVSVAIGSFINFVLVQEDDWQKKPRYYALRTSIANQAIEI